MSRLNIFWEDTGGSAVMPDMQAAIRIGISMVVRNQFRLLAMKDPFEQRDLWDEMIAVVAQSGQLEGGGDLTRPISAPFRWETRQGQRLLQFQIVSGFVPNGLTRRGVRHGWFKVVIAADDELAEVLQHVYRVRNSTKA